VLGLLAAVIGVEGLDAFDVEGTDQRLDLGCGP